MRAIPVAEPGQGTGILSRLPAVESRPRSQCNICPARFRAPCGGIQDSAEAAALDLAHSPHRWIASGQQIREAEGSEARIYTVLHGWVSLMETFPDGRTVILRFALPGDVLAIRPAATNSSRSAVALGPALVCSFTQSRHRRLLDEWPEFARRWQAMLEHDLQQAYSHLAEMAVGDARQRLAALLWELAYRSLRREPRSGDQIHIPISQIQLSAATGLTAVHVSRTLSGLRDEGLLDLKGHVISIHNPAAVARLSGVSEETTLLWQ